MKGEMSDWNGKLTRQDIDVMSWERKVVLATTRPVVEWMTLEEQAASTAPDPDQDVEAVLYMKGDLLIVKFDNVLPGFLRALTLSDLAGQLVVDLFKLTALLLELFLQLAQRQMSLDTSQHFVRLEWLWDQVEPTGGEGFHPVRHFI